MKSRAKLLIDLEAIFGFAAGTVLTINVAPDHSTRGKAGLLQQEWTCENIMPIILPVLCWLKNFGYHIRVLLRGVDFGSSRNDFVREGVCSFESYKADFAKVSVSHLYRCEGEAYTSSSRQK